MDIPERHWPESWGFQNPALDFRIWYMVPGEPTRSVMRRFSAFALPEGTTFDLYDHHHRPLEYKLLREKDRVLVRPKYPEYGMLEVVHTPIVETNNHHQVVLKPLDGPIAKRTETKIRGVSATPGRTYFGPLWSGRYEVTLVRGFSSSTYQVVRVLGQCLVGKGYGVYDCK